MIRVGGPGDAFALLPLVEDFYRVDGHQFDRDFVLAGLRPLLESDRHGFVLVAGGVADSDLDGYLVITWGYSLESGGRDALVDEFYVSRQGQGVGGRLLDSALGMLAERGIRKVFLETERDNARVRSMYQRHGFVEQDSVWMSTDLGLADT